MGGLLRCLTCQWVLTLTISLGDAMQPLSEASCSFTIANKGHALPGTKSTASAVVVQIGEWAKS
jgi:hypothetical protein